MAEHRHEHAVGILGIDEDRGDLLALPQSHVAPRLAAVGGLVHAVADREVGPLQPFPTADVDHARVGRGDGDRTDRAGGLIVEDRRPHATVVGRAPHAAVVDTDVEESRVAGDARRGHRAPATERADRPPAQRGVARGIDLLG